MLHNGRFELRFICLVTAAVLLTAAAEAARYDDYPRLGFSAAADRYTPVIEVRGDEVFALHVIVLPPEGATSLGHDFSTFHWAVMEVCCGGAATVLDEDYNPSCQNDGNLFSGVVTTFEPCAAGDVIHIATITMRMVVEHTGEYVLMAAPLSQAITCDADLVVLTDMMVTVDYTGEGTAVAASSWSEVKSLFD